jgi:hypothetical protein
VTDWASVASLGVSLASLGVAAVALGYSRDAVNIARNQLKLQTMFEARELQERRARSDLRVAIQWSPEDAVYREATMNAPMSLVITLTNEGDRDAEDVVVDFLVPEDVRDQFLAGGERLPVLEALDTESRSYRARRHRRTIERVGRIPVPVDAGLDLRDLPEVPVRVQVACDDQPESKRVQTFDYVPRKEPSPP